MSYESGAVTAQVTGSTIAIGIPAGATMVCRQNMNVSSGTTDLYTVTAGKTLYILSAFVSGGIGAVNSSNTGEIIADVNGTGTYYTLVSEIAYSNGTVFGQGNNSVSFPLPIPIPATKKVQIRCSVNGNCGGGFVGYEV